MKNLFLILILSIPVCLFGQEKQTSTSRIQYLIDYHYNFGLSEKGDWADINRSDFKMYGNSIHFSVIYNLNNKLALGAGIGLDRYENPGFNTFPLFISCHYTPLKTISKGYMYSNLGYALDNSSFVPGLLFDLGFGYKKIFKKHFGLNFQLGYNFKQRKENMLILVDSDNHVNCRYHQYRHSISIGIGLIF